MKKSARQVFCASVKGRARLCADRNTRSVVLRWDTAFLVVVFLHQTKSERKFSRLGLKLFLNGEKNRGHPFRNYRSCFHFVSMGLFLLYVPMFLGIN